MMHVAGFSGFDSAAHLVYTWSRVRSMGQVSGTIPHLTCHAPGTPEQ